MRITTHSASFNPVPAKIYSQREILVANKTHHELEQTNGQRKTMPPLKGISDVKNARLLPSLPKPSEPAPDDCSILEFVSYLESCVTPGPSSFRIRDTLSLFRTFSPSGQATHLPKLYLQWEHYQVGGESSSALRLEVCEIIRRDFEGLLALPNFGLIFLRDRPQEFLICRSILVATLQNASRFIDRIADEPLSHVISWVERAPRSGHPIPLNTDSAVPGYHSEWTGFFMRLSEKLYRELAQNLGDSLAQSFYERAYDDAYDTYALLDTFSIAGYLLPNELLDAEKMGRINRSALRETYLRCIESSNHHTTRLSGQNRELTEIREELELSKAELEERVATRTEELSTAKEAAELAARAKGEFLATMSHELRTPLNAVLGFSEMIAQAALGPIDQRYRDYGTDINKSGEHLLSLVNDVLDLSKLESGKFEIHGEHVHISEILNACRSMVAGLTNEAGVKLSIDTEADVCPAWADPLRVKQIVVNLLSNAIKFTEPGGLVNASSRMDSVGNVVIEVEDNGIGMDAAGIEQALEPFGQIDSPLNRTHGGTGLGLPVVKHLAELHGGALTIVSSLGAGTRVTVLLPCVAPAAKAAAS